MHGGSNMTEQKDWHLDKKVTLALIFALMCNACGSVWWAAKLDATVYNHEQRIVQNAASLAEVRSSQGSVNESLARIQEGMKYQTEMLREVREQLKDGRP